MPNYKGRRSRRKHDDWHYFDQLPQAVRLRCAASTQPWSGSWLLTYYRKLVKQWGEERALRGMLARFDDWDRMQAHKAWITPKPGKRADPSPCAEAHVGPLVTRYACVG